MEPVQEAHCAVVPSAGLSVVPETHSPGAVFFMNNDGKKQRWSALHLQLSFVCLVKLSSGFTPRLQPQHLERVCAQKALVFPVSGLQVQVHGQTQEQELSNR